METLEEQIEYGGRCRHGTAIGTPGGYDLMCGLCEDGFNIFVADPAWSLLLTLGQEAGEYETGSLILHTWRETYDVETVTRQIRRQADRWDDMTRTGEFNKIPVPTLHWEARRMDSGFWTDDN